MGWSTHELGWVWFCCVDFAKTQFIYDDHACTVLEVNGKVMTKATICTYCIMFSVHYGGVVGVFFRDWHSNDVYDRSHNHFDK